MQPRLLIKRAKYATVEHRRNPVRLHGDWSFLVWNTSKDLHLKEGILKVTDLKQPDGTTITSSKGVEFVIISPSFTDMFNHISKGPQTIPLKDLGWIVGKTGLTKKSTVIDIGGGSGAVSCFLAQYAKHVYCYELLEKHCDIIKSNAERLNIKNISVAQRDVIEKPIKCRAADLVMIDLPTPWMIAHYVGALTQVGGYVLNYSPPIISTQKFVQTLPENFVVETTTEIIERPWKVEGDAVRPSTTKIGHSGFLTLARKVYE